MLLSLATAAFRKAARVVNFATGERSMAGCGDRHCLYPSIDVPDERKAIMKMTKIAMLVLTIAVALFILIPNLSWAGDDGATLYKAKCAACHGVDAAGKPAAKIPSLVSDEAKKLSDADLTDAVANGGKNKKPTHAFSQKGLGPDQIKMVISYIRELQKK